MKKVLLIAFHFPPVKGSSGLHRSLSMAKYLSGFGWLPAVLTAAPRAYEITSEELLPEIPEETLIARAFALDSARHLSFKGRYFGWTALPDRWATWWFGAVINGFRLIKNLKPNLIWSTYPIATAHLIALTLHKLTGIPWVADFRDSMTEDNYPRNPRVRSVYRWIERKTVKNAAKVVFTTPGAAEMYAERYPDITLDKWSVIENAVDEGFFHTVEKELAKNPSIKGQKLKLLHSGILYPSERDPNFFFNAVQSLKKKEILSANNIEIILRASTNEVQYRSWVKKLGIDDLIFFEPAIPYAEAIKEMLLSDGLLIFQAKGCNHQIPAKIYEYFRSRRPILGLTDPAGNTADLLARESGTMLAVLDSEEDIVKQLETFIRFCHDNRSKPVRAVTGDYSRHARVSQYVNILNSVGT